jgi:hypothetical protein
VKTTENNTLTSSVRTHIAEGCIPLGHIKDSCFAFTCVHVLLFKLNCFEIILGDARPVKQSGNLAGASPTAAAVSPPSSAKLRYFRVVMALPRNNRII